MIKTFSKISRWFFIPTDLELSLLYLTTGIYIVVATDVVVPNIWFNFVMFSLLAIVLFLAIRSITFFVAICRNKVKHFWIRWAQLALITVFLFLVFTTDLDLIVRLWLSENELNKEIEYLQTLPPENINQMLKLPSKPVGCFNIKFKIYDEKSRAFWFHTGDGQALFGPVSLIGGILYCEEQKPPEIAETVYEHLYGPWWQWAQDI